MEDDNDKVKGSGKGRSKKPKRLEFEGWGSKNLIEFLQSLGKDTTEKISEYDVVEIVTTYIREMKRETPETRLSKKRKTKTKSKTIVCDEKLRSLFGRSTINIIKVAVLVEKHYVENQDEELDFLYDEEDDEQLRLCLTDKVDKPKKVVVKKPEGTIAAIVSDNIKLVYLKKSLVQELAKTPETFESKVVGAFVRVKNPYQDVQVTPYQLVQVTGVKEGNAIDGNLLQVTNYSYYVNDAPVSMLSDKDFSKEECEELHQRIKNGCTKRLTVVDMEEKVRSLHEDLTNQWLASELKLLEVKISRASENGWRRELSQYLDKRELLKNPEEQSRLLREVPEVVAEELEPECVDDDDDVEVDNDFTEPNLRGSEKEEVVPSDSPVSCIRKNLEKSFCDTEEQPTWNAYAGDIDLNELPGNVITQNNDSEPPANGLTQNMDTEQPATDQMMDTEPPATVEIMDTEQPATDQMMDTEPPATVEIMDTEQPATDQILDTELQATVEIMDTEPPATDQMMDTEPQANAIKQNKDFDIQAKQNIDPIIKVEVIDLDVEIIDLESKPYQAYSNQVEIIDLTDDDEDNNNNDNQAIHEKHDPEKVMWYYELQGKTHGPFSLTLLKEWNDEEFFVDTPDLKVWKSGESSVALTKLLPLVNT